jgi:hypothetical protein
VEERWRWSQLWCLCWGQFEFESIFGCCHLSPFSSLEDSLHLVW